MAARQPTQRIFSAAANGGLTGANGSVTRQFPTKLMKKLSTLAALLALATLPLSGCKTLEEKKKEDTALTKPKKQPTTLRDQSGDVAFQSFLNRLRAAVGHRDVETLASMMTEQFGYSYEPGGEGAGVFKYWDENNVWPELKLVLSERFVPSEKNFMVAPPEFVAHSEQSEPYTGYRAGIMLQNGGWKFAYFVKGIDPQDLQQ